MNRLVIIALLLNTTWFTLPDSVASVQMNTHNDTLNIGEVIVRGRPFFNTAGFNKLKVDSLLLQENINLSVSDILKNGLPAFIKSYGPGGIATISMRGAGASHTVVTWNGMSLNSPMLGQADLILIPALAADEIIIHNGGSSVSVAHGGLGGVVSLGTKPAWNKPPSQTVSMSAGSYGRASASYTGRYGSGNWRFVSRLNNNYAKNNFMFINPYLTGETTKERRDNASFLQQAFIQEAWLKNSKAVTGMKLWMQRNKRQIPVPANVSPESHDEQLDSKRIMAIISYDRYFQNRNSFSSYAGIQSESNLYIDRKTSIYSPASHRTVTIANTFFGENNSGLRTRTSLVSDFGVFSNNGYGEDARKKKRIISSLNFSADYRLNDRFSININGTAALVDSDWIPPDLSAGFEYSPFSSDALIIKSNMALKSRVPSLNDLYWVPGGNMNLKPERGANSEISVDLSTKLTEAVSVQFHNSLYLNQISDMIVWLPQSSGIWSPANRNITMAGGTESELSLKWESAKHSAALQLSHTFTRSTEKGSRKQLEYIPEQTCFAVLRLKRGIMNAGSSINYTGRRYITAGNSEYLPSYSDTEIWAGVSASSGNKQYEVKLKMENVFNISYQTMAYHPMPMRSVLVSIVINTGKELTR